MPLNSTIVSNNEANFKCECVHGFKGDHCELSPDLCTNITCENRGICRTIGFAWKCFCFDTTLFYGHHCQYKSNKLKVLEVLSKSFAYVAIGVISATCTFIILMDVLKYVFHIDPVEFERENYRKRCEANRRNRTPIRIDRSGLVLKYQYVI